MTSPMRHLTVVASLCIAIARLAHPAAQERHSVTQIFGDRFTRFETEAIDRGYLMGAALAGSTAYVLVQGTKGRPDAILKVDADTGKTLATWEIGRRSAGALTHDGDSLWVMSRSGAA